MDMLWPRYAHHSFIVYSFLYAANCGYYDQQSAFNISQPNLVYRGVPTVGTIADLSCPSGMIPNGTNTTVCTGNGEWEPDPKDVQCIGVPP